MKKRLIAIPLPILTLVLELLPYGAVLNFANPEGDPWRQTYSYFDPTPYGYAHVTPFLTAIATCAALALLAIYLITGKGAVGSAARIVLAVGAVLSLGFLLFGWDSVSAVGVLISVSLIAEGLLLHFIMKISKKEPAGQTPI